MLRTYFKRYSTYIKRPSCAECAWNMQGQENLCVAMATHDLAHGRIQFETIEQARKTGTCGPQGRWFRDKDGSKQTATKLGSEVVLRETNNPPSLSNK